MFDAKKVKDECVQWIRDFIKSTGDRDIIVGLSGGKDSTIVAALCCEAVGPENVIGVLMPNHTQDDIGDAKHIANHLGIRYYEINIGDAVDDIIRQIEKNDIIPTSDTTINLPARIRMSALYAMGQSFKCVVANTSNLSEDWVGYATRYGDSAGDFSPLGNLTVTEVKAIGEELDIPEQLVYKVPSDGLCNETDEERFGFTYDTLDTYIRTGEIDDEEIKIKIDQMHAANKFKMELMPQFNPLDLEIKIEF